MEPKSSARKIADYVSRATAKRVPSVNSKSLLFVRFHSQQKQISITDISCFLLFAADELALCHSSQALGRLNREMTNLTCCYSGLCINHPHLAPGASVCSDYINRLFMPESSTTTALQQHSQVDGKIALWSSIIRLVTYGVRSTHVQKGSPKPRSNAHERTSTLITICSVPRAKSKYSHTCVSQF